MKVLSGDVLVVWCVGGECGDSVGGWGERLVGRVEGVVGKGQRLLVLLMLLTRDRWVKNRILDRTVVVRKCARRQTR